MNPVYREGVAQRSMVERLYRDRLPVFEARPEGSLNR